MNYIISGNSPFLIKKELTKIANDLQVDEMSTIKLRGDNIDIDALIMECQMIPFFSENKLVIVEEATFLSSKANKEVDLNPLMEYLKAPNLSTTLVFVLSENKLDKRKKIVKEVLKLMRVINCDVDEQNYQSTILTMLNDQGLVLPKDALKTFLARSTSDLMSVQANIDKLLLYPDTITPEVVEALVVKPLANDDQSKFDFINAIYRKDGKAIFSLYHDFKLIGYDPLAMIGLMESQLRFVLEVKILLSLKYSNDQISERLNAHPYRVQKIVQQTKMFGGREVLALLNELCDLDLQAKKGLIDIEQGLEVFLLKRCK